MFVNLACWAAIIVELVVPSPPARTAKRSLPPIPSLGRSLLPNQLAHEFVMIEIYDRALAQMREKFGDDSTQAETYREALKSSRARITRLEHLIKESGDPSLSAKADAKIEERLRHHREGLTLTPQQLLARAKREQEEVDRKRIEYEKGHEERVNRLLAEYNLPPLYKVAKPESEKR